MKERPILFSTAMVKAILDVNKTMTRRVVKNQNLDGAPRGGFKAYENDAGNFGFSSDDNDWTCPYGKPGDLLWVRETWGIAWNDGALIDPSVNYRATLERFPIVREETMKLWQELYLKPRKNSWQPKKWKPSIFMPKWVCRIWLRVKSVRVERLQDISEEDAKAEGATLAMDIPDLGEDGVDTYRDSFFRLWNSINADRGYGLAVNPWVWVVEFERVDRPQAAKEGN